MSLDAVLDRLSCEEPADRVPDSVTLPGPVDDVDERAAIIAIEAGAPSDWADALARLDPRRPPVDLAGERWRLLLDDAGRMIDEGGAARAQACGWSAADILGCVTIEAGAAVYRNALLWRINGGGLLTLDVKRAVVETADGQRVVYAPTPERPPAWTKATRST